MWIFPYGIKTFYAFKKVKMFNKNKMKTESNNSYKKIFRFEDSTHRNLEEFEAMSKAMTEEIFGPEMKKAKKDEQQKFLELSG